MTSVFNKSSPITVRNYLQLLVPLPLRYHPSLPCALVEMATGAASRAAAREGLNGWWRGHRRPWHAMRRRPKHTRDDRRVWEERRHGLHSCNMQQTTLNFPPKPCLSHRFRTAWRPGRLQHQDGERHGRGVHCHDLADAPPRAVGWTYALWCLRARERER